MERVIKLTTLWIWVAAFVVVDIGIGLLKARYGFANFKPLEHAMASSFTLLWFAFGISLLASRTTRSPT